MTDTVTIEAPKKEVSPEQAMARHIRTANNVQTSRRLRRLARQKTSMMDGLWATALSIVFDNTESTGRGKLAPFLR